MNTISLRDHPIIIGIACSTTGKRVGDFEPIAIALQIIEASTGNVLDTYSSYIKITEEAWNARDLRSEFKHRITWETLESEGQDLEQVQSQIVDFLIRNDVFHNAFFVSFNIQFQCNFLRKILGDNLLEDPKPGILSNLLEQSIGSKKHKIEKDMKIPLRFDCEDLGYFNYPRYHIARSFGIAYKRITCLALLQLPDFAAPHNHLFIINDIARVVRGLLQQG